MKQWKEYLYVRAGGETRTPANIGFCQAWVPESPHSVVDAMCQRGREPFRALFFKYYIC